MSATLIKMVLMVAFSSFFYIDQEYQGSDGAIEGGDPEG